MPAQDRRDAFDVNVINTRGNLIGGFRSAAFRGNNARNRTCLRS